MREGRRGIGIEGEEEGGGGGGGGVCGGENKG